MPPSPTPKQASTSLTLKQGSEDWNDWRRRCTVSVPGKYSSLYFLCAKVLGMESLVPMTYRAHWAMCLFAEGMTGIPEIDNAVRKLVLVPRGVGKSSIITKGLPIHRLIKNKDSATILANEIQDNAEKFLGSIKSAMERNDLLRALFPDVIPQDTKNTTWKASEIVVNRSKERIDPSIRAIGVGGTATGAHADMWLLDDILSKNAANAARVGNFAEIEKVNQWVIEIEPMLADRTKDLILLVGTYWWIGDTYQWIEGTEEEPGLWGHGEKKQVWNWQIRLPDGTIQTHKIYKRGKLAVFCRDIYDGVGDSFFPEKLPNELLQEMESQDPAFFASQYRLSPAAGAAAEFKESWLRPYVMDGDSLRFVNTDGRLEYVPLKNCTVVVSVDPAFSKKGDACRTAIPVTAVYRDNVFLLEDFAEKGLGVNDIAQKVAGFCLQYKVSKVFVETIVAQITVADAIRKALEESHLPYIQIEEIPSHQGQKKTMRILGMEPFFKTGHFFYQPHRHTKFVGEYIAFPRSGLRDVLDALSFQRAEWERLSRLAGHVTANTEYQGAIQADLARIRRSNQMDRRSA